ncbi:DUF1801 domain-containing protein [Sphingorhabdus sp. Alg239-R122]|uniref:DUF1801 domain-containing protein n=1 Tax=Sphingorhabdus sp. Alg239-R122 TaxID=2305989 RepID=UPI0013DC5A3F|nr:DUF1801 domain-containing protein [Sphingorhabdus sp. Alg239-R122]
MSETSNIPEGVRKVFDSYPDSVSHRLYKLRRWILEVADADERIGIIEESLKWGQPSYAPAVTKSGTAVRIDTHCAVEESCALYVHCGTSLVARWRDIYGGLAFDGNRAVIFDPAQPLPKAIVHHCIAMAFTYRLPA